MARPDSGHNGVYKHDEFRHCLSRKLSSVTWCGQKNSQTDFIIVYFLLKIPKNLFFCILTIEYLNSPSLYLIFYQVFVLTFLFLKEINLTD